MEEPYIHGRHICKELDTLTYRSATCSAKDGPIVLGEAEKSETGRTG